MVNTNINNTTLNEITISLFLIDSKDGIIIHTITKDLIWDNFDWVIENGVLEIINLDTKEKFEIENLGKWKVTDDEYIETTKDDKCVWIEMLI